MLVTVWAHVKIVAISYPIVLFAPLAAYCVYQVYLCEWVEVRRHRFVLRSHRTTRSMTFSWFSWCVTVGRSFQHCVQTSPPSAAGSCSSTKESTIKSYYGLVPSVIQKTINQIANLFRRLWTDIVKALPIDEAFSAAELVQLPNTFTVPQSSNIAWKKPFCAKCRLFGLCYFYSYFYNSSENWNLHAMHLASRDRPWYFNWLSKYKRCWLDTHRICARWACSSLKILDVDWNLEVSSKCRWTSQ